MAIRQGRLDQRTILQGARAVLDQTGLDGFTTRALAAHLDVQQPALYWHFKTKAALLAALADDILVREHHASMPEDDEAWDGFVLRNARSFREALLAVRDGARLHAEYHGRPDLAEVAGLPEGPRRQVALLTGQGFSEADAVSTLIAVGRYTVGVVLEEQAQEDKTGPGAEGGRAEEVKQFEFGLNALIRGAAPTGPSRTERNSGTQDE